MGEEIAMNWRSGLLGLLMLVALLVTLYLWARKIERQSVGWLAVVVLGGCIDAVQMTIGFAGAFDVWPGLTFLPTQVLLIMAPALYFHTFALTTGKPLGMRWWLLAPGILYWLYQVWAFSFLGDHLAKWEYSGRIHVPFVLPVYYVTALGLLTVSLWLSWRQYRRYRNWLAQNRSDDDDFDPVWIKHLIFLSAASAFIWLAAKLAGWFLDFGYYDLFLADFAALAIMCAIAVEALVRMQKPFPKIRDSSDDHALDAISQPRRDWIQEGERLKGAVTDGQWFLEPRLSLDDLAQRLATNHVYISRALNRGLNASFSDFVNGLRVEHAKALLAQNDATVLEVALDSGFGSKASFNRLFKAREQITPTQFRASLA